MARARTIDKTGKTTGSTRLTLRLTDAQLEKLRKQAERKGCSVSELVRLKALEGVAA
jgi:hypothetical protein